jgi:cation/acetate symporter
MIAGFGIALYYLLATRYGAVAFVETWGWLSNATAAQLGEFAQLKAAYTVAGPDARAGAWTALDTHARSIANWWGVRQLSAAAFGLPAGFVVTIGVSLLTKAPSPEVQDLVDGMRRPTGDTMTEDTPA